jgi:ribonuclease HI/ketosteroid isomerase-like protein
VTAAASRSLVARYWARMQANDFAAAAECMSPDAVVEWPQSGERIRGRANFVAVNANYPAAGRWVFGVERIVASGDEVVTDVTVTDGVLRARAITFSTVRDGQIVRQVEYWPEPFSAPAWRAGWVEPDVAGGPPPATPAAPSLVAPPAVGYGAGVTTPSVKTAASWTLRCDGGSRGNPGPAAYGFVLTDPAGSEVVARGVYIGSTTNNVAEYKSLIAGLAAALEAGASPLAVVMDSELVIRQMTGQYRVKNEGLKPLHAEARAAAAKLPRVTYSSVRRDDNGRADGLVNEALDQALSRE